MDWTGWATFGFIATVTLTGLMVAGQLGGLSRMDIPLMLGTILTPNTDRARLVGLGAHLVNGQIFALAYAAAFAHMGGASWPIGAGFGVIHGFAALTLLVPLLPGVHPRMASERSGPSLEAVLEPPGWLALNYGRATPAVTVAAHAAYGAILGGFLGPR